jgi:hypothetical protein
VNGEIGHLDLTFSSCLKLFGQNLLPILNLEFPVVHLLVYATNMTLILWYVQFFFFGFYTSTKILIKVE